MVNMSESPIANPALSPNNVEIMRVYLAHASSIWRIKSELSCPWKTLFSNCTRNERPSVLLRRLNSWDNCLRSSKPFPRYRLLLLYGSPKVTPGTMSIPSWNDWIMTAILPWDPKVAFRMALSLTALDCWSTLKLLQAILEGQWVDCSISRPNWTDPWLAHATSSCTKEVNPKTSSSRDFQDE